MEGSDIDVLQIDNSINQPYKINDINVSVYSEKKLTALAKQGSLFVLHLRVEGIIIADTSKILKRCIDSYKNPLSYAKHRQALVGCLALLDITEEAYLLNWSKYNEVLIFLFRTYLYIKSVESGVITFSASLIAKKEGFRFERVLSLRHAAVPNWKLFKEASVLIAGELGGRLSNPYQSIEALVSNSARDNPLLISLGVKLLSDETDDFAYGFMSIPETDTYE